jgi:hypothetical protein
VFHHDKQCGEKVMTRLKLLGVVAIAAAAIASPSLAQQVISEPGYCAQFYPNANCQNKGPGNPYTGDYQRRVQNEGMWREDTTVGVARTRPRTPRRDPRYDR